MVFFLLRFPTKLRLETDGNFAAAQPLKVVAYVAADGMALVVAFAFDSEGTILTFLGLFSCPTSCFFFFEGVFSLSFMTHSHLTFFFRLWFFVFFFGCFQIRKITAGWWPKFISVRISLTMGDQIKRWHPGNCSISIMKSDVFGKGNSIKDMAMLGINVKFLGLKRTTRRKKKLPKNRGWFFGICQNKLPVCKKESTKLVAASNNADRATSRFHSELSYIFLSD